MDRRNRQGSLNPMWGKQHTQATKEKISQSQKARYNAIRKALKENTSADEATDRKIERLNAMLEDGTITTVSELYKAIHILFIAERISRKIVEELREIEKKKTRYQAINNNI